MAKPRIYLHRAGSWWPLFMDRANMSALLDFADVVCERDRDRPLSAGEVVARMAGCAAILSLNGEGAADVTAEVVRSVDTVRVVCIAQYWGAGHFSDLTAKTGVPVIEGSNAGTVAVAEWIVGAALLGIRRLHVFDRALKSGSQWGEAGMLAGSVAGMVGLGRIGRYTAQSLRALGVKVIAFSRSCRLEDAASIGVDLVSLDHLLRTADIVCLNHRVTDATKGLLGAREFAMIKPGAVLINAARAGLYDEAVLVEALRTGRFSACLDVFATEPLPARHPFRAMDNVFITPHIAGNNPAMFLRCARQSIATLRDYFEGRGMIDKKYAFP
jgi:phosphoglycerate dehydrogenase-like enzyme